MPLLLDTFRSGAGLDLRTANCINVGLINNMPDAAFDATERQFTGLLRAASANAVVRLVPFAMPDVPRSDLARREVAERYRDISELWDSQFDGLIVTGTEPATKNLKDEPYWKTLAQVVDWAGAHTASTIWSCLAAHAAVLHGEGIERSPFAEKLLGVFDCEPADDHPMTADAKHGMRVPHSRLNDLPERALISCGYHILIRSPAAGVDMFCRQERSLQLFFQGHPEYEVDTLLREYRRDIRRFLRGERQSYPALPQAYFNEKAAAVATAFRERAISDRDDMLIDSFPLRALAAGLEYPWQNGAVGIYRKWLDYLRGRKAERRSYGMPLRRTWRDWPGGAVPTSADDAHWIAEDA
jgi:homoserine O-succinyltransferase/O-acetyltransferase